MNAEKENLASAPDKLADAAFFQTYSDELDAAVMSEESLHQLAHDSFKAGAVKALQEAEEQLVRQDSFSERTLRIIDEVATTYMEQETPHGTE